jgi:putative spermidine/putrescine transport system permease protein
MTTQTTPPPTPSGFDPIRSISTFFYQNSWLSLLLMLLPVLIWLGVVYFGSIAAMLQQSFYTLDYFTGQVVEEYTLDTYKQLDTPANKDIIQRTVTMAALVTVACAVLAFPLAYYMAKFASYRMRGLLYLGVMLPLWSSYLVRVYSWKLILSEEGVLNWFLEKVQLTGVVEWLLERPAIGGPSLAISPLGTFIVFVYIWLPYMVLPITAALERVPNSLTEASSDLGARPFYTFRRIIFPLAFPGVIAGSIFTFSLTLGDYIVPSIVGNSSYYIGSVVLVQQGTAGNIPLAAAFTTVPIVIMGIYLLVARRLGAFDAL